MNQKEYELSAALFTITEVGEGRIVLDPETMAMQTARAIAALALKLEELEDRLDRHSHQTGAN